MLGYDAAHAGDLVTSVRVWLEHDRQTDRAAAALHIHPNTLLYRVRRFEQISGMAHIRATPGFERWSWPHPMPPEQNLADLRRHAEDFAARTGFTYTVLAGPDDQVVGCVYIYPVKPEGGGTDAEGAASGEHGGAAAGAADVRSWVRADRAELDVPLYTAVCAWLRDAWPFTSVRYAPRPVGGGAAPDTAP